jgi:hypothetical protein
MGSTSARLRDDRKSPHENAAKHSRAPRRSFKVQGLVLGCRHTFCMCAACKQRECCQHSAQLQRLSPCWGVTCTEARKARGTEVVRRQNGWR